MGRDDSLHRAEATRPMDTQQDHPESHRELQDHAWAERISADIEDKILIGWRAISVWECKLGMPRIDEDLMMPLIASVDEGIYGF